MTTTAQTGKGQTHGMGYKDKTWENPTVSAHVVGMLPPPKVLSIQNYFQPRW